MVKIVKEYTPGDMVAEGSNIKHVASGEVIAYVYTANTHSPHIEEIGREKANAVLFAAAPKLVDALINAIKARAVIAFLQSKPVEFDDLKGMADHVNTNWVKAVNDEERAALTKAGILK